MANEANPISTLTENQFLELVELYKQEKYTELVKRGEAFLRDHPADVKLQNIIGSAWAGLGEYQKSINLLKSVVSEDNSYANGHHNLGLTYLHAGQLKSAVETLLIAVSLSPNSPSFKNSLAAAYFKFGDLRKAVETMQTAIKINGANAMLHLRVGEYLLAQGKFSAARETLENALVDDPTDGQTMILLGETYIKLDLPQEAMEQLSAASAINPSDPDLYMTMARFWRRYNQPPKELDALNRVIKLKPEHSEGYAVLAEALARLGNRDGALKAYKKCLELESNHAEARHFIAALQGNSTTSAPKEYITKLFDQYAANFENSLTAELGYRVPSVIAKLLSSRINSGEVFNEVLDLGCGSGLAGQAISGLVGRICGVDLSKNMIAIAREKDVYDQIDVGDITDAVKRNPQLYDLYVAADVLIYLGDMEELFSALRHNAKSGATFVFTTEHKTAGNYELLPSGRYAHSKEYVTNLCQKHNMEIVSSYQIDLRKEADTVLAGILYAVTIA